MVRYVHNGNPHLSADRVRLTVRQFADAAEVVSDDVIVTIRVSPRPAGAVFAGVAEARPLVVDTRRSPLSDVITADIIQFRYNFSGGSVCTLRFNADGGRFRPQWLMSGDLVSSDGAPVGNLSIDCRDFLVAGFRYRCGAGRPRTDVDYIPLTASVDNWTSSATTERVFVLVRLVGGLANSPPTLVRRSGQRSSPALVAEQFVPMLLNGDVLTGRDDVTRPEHLLLTVLSPRPEFEVQSRGYFVHRRAPWRPVVAFWQRDLLDGSVAFRAPTVGVSPRGARVEAVLTATDGHFASSGRLRLPITVRPAPQPLGPKIVHNRGLTVVRGGSVCLGSDSLRIVDAAGLDRVEVRILRGGPLHGNLTLRDDDSITESFRWLSVEQCDVVYRHHVDSADERDEILLRMSNGRRSVRTRVVVDVLPGTAAAPRLKLNDPTEVRQHGYAQLTTIHLDTSSQSSSDVLYTITSPPRYGQVLMMYRPMTRGRPVSHFTQLDLDKGHIWYRHLGRSSPLRDAFRFLLRPEASRNNVTTTADDERIHKIVVRPHAKDHPPRLVTPVAGRTLTVRETDVQPLRRERFRYRDGEHPDEDVVFVVTCQPFVVGSSATVDAGLIAYHDDAAFRDKNSTIVPLRTFTQSMIDGEMVAYVPPMNDIGSRPLKVRFIYSVSDLHGNFEVDQTFDVTVLPVNNQVFFEQSSTVCVTKLLHGLSS